MSIETRSSSALFKRAEQLRNWEESETNRAPVIPKEEKSRRIKFTSGCVFLAACAAGDKEEVLKLLENGAKIDTANVDGLTALHQACIDDNLDMVEFLVEHGADVNKGDNEGWTPLHATASCGFLSIAKYLIEKGANVAAINNDGELPVDIAECQKMEDLLQEELDKRGIDCAAARSEEERIMLRDAKEWFSTKSPSVDIRHPDTGATPLHVAAAKGYTDVMKILLQCGADMDAQDVDGWTPLHAAAHWGQKEACQLLAENLADMDARNFVGQTPFDLADTETFRYLEDLKKKQNKDDVINRRQAKKRIEAQDRTAEAETPSKVIKVEISGVNEKHEDSIEKKNKVNSLSINDSSVVPNKEDLTKLPPCVPPKQVVDTTNTDENPPAWRRPISRTQKQDLPSPTKTPTSFRDRSNSSEMKIDNEVTLRRNNSFQNDREFYMKYKALHERIQAYRDTTAVIPYSTQRPQSDIILPTYKRSQQHYSSKEDGETVSSSTTTTSNTSPASSPQSNSQPVRRSFVPPVRDEESETQRKAHAKRVRETRRSTQGVTLEDIKSAEQLVKKTNQANNSSSGNSNDQFKLEDASKPSEPPSTPSYVRRTTNPNNTNTRPSSAPVETAETTTVTLPLRRPKSQEENDQDKENDARNAQATLATQAAIQRRRRPKRRSTGVVTLDDLDQEKDPAGGGDCEESSKLSNDSGTDRSSRSRLGSTTDIRNENGEIDYKKLYEQAIAENERLKDKLKKTEEELRETKHTLEKLNLVTSKNSLSELEKRERRAMERKLSEMEEELKQLQKLKAENERLKADNRSLTRVINKLTNSAKK